MLCIFAGNLLTTLMDRQQSLLDASLSEATKLTRAAQLRRYKKFCKLCKFSEFPCSSVQARLYATYLSSRVKPVSVRNYLSAVWYQCKIQGFPEFSLCFLVKQLLNGIDRTYSNFNSPSRYPLSVLELLAMFKLLNMQIFEHSQFWLAVLLCFRGLLRKCHVTSTTHSLKCGDIIVSSSNVSLQINSSKTDQFGKHPFKIYLHHIPGSPLCVKKLLKNAIRNSDKNSELVNLQYSVFNSRLKDLSRKLGLPYDRISTHSLRHGGASMLKSLGVPVTSIMSVGNWKSSAVYNYLHNSKADLLLIDYLPVKYYSSLM